MVNHYDALCARLRDLLRAWERERARHTEAALEWPKEEPVDESVMHHEAARIYYECTRQLVEAMSK